jgi:hypothetical protein
LFVGSHSTTITAGQPAGRRIFEQEQIARAVELDLGISSCDEIELITGDTESRALAESLRPILVAG